MAAPGVWPPVTVTTKQAASGVPASSAAALTEPRPPGPGLKLPVPRARGPGGKGRPWSGRRTGHPESAP